MIIIISIIKQFLKEMKRKIMTPDKKEIKSKETELMAKIKEHKEEKNEKSLPIFLWTD